MWDLPQDAVMEGPAVVRVQGGPCTVFRLAKRAVLRDVQVDLRHAEPGTVGVELAGNQSRAENVWTGDDPAAPDTTGFLLTGVKRIGLSGGGARGHARGVVVQSNAPSIRDMSIQRNALGIDLAACGYMSLFGALVEANDTGIRITGGCQANSFGSHFENTQNVVRSGAGCLVSVGSAFNDSSRSESDALKQGCKDVSVGDR